MKLGIRFGLRPGPKSIQTLHHFVSLATQQNGTPFKYFKAYPRETDVSHVTQFSPRISDWISDHEPNQSKRRLDERRTPRSFFRFVSLSNPILFPSIGSSVIASIHFVTFGLVLKRFSSAADYKNAVQKTRRSWTSGRREFRSGLWTARYCVRHRRSEPRRKQTSKERAFTSFLGSGGSPRFPLSSFDESEAFVHDQFPFRNHAFV